MQMGAGSGRGAFDQGVAFRPEAPKWLLVGCTALFRALLVGRSIAARVHGDFVRAVQSSNPMVFWLVLISGHFGSQDESEMAYSSLSEALRHRLYFDHYYEKALGMTAIPLASFAAWFDRTVIDWIVKKVESHSVLGSVQIRRVTTGRARDYILLVAVGALSIFALPWGVSG